MKRSGVRWLAVCAFAAFAGVARAEDASEEKAAGPAPVALSEVKAFPEAYRRVPFELALLYHGPRNVYNPFYTVFEPSSYANFAAWPADAAIYQRDVYCNDHPLFYVDRNSEELQRALLAMRPCTWFNARCIVRSVAQGRAWIEVLELTKVGPTLDATDLRHLVRATSLAASGEYDHAMVELDLARMLNAPARFLARCRGEEGRIALAANKPERALLALQQAWKQLPDDKLVAALLDRASTQVALRQQGGAPAVEPTAPSPVKVVPAPHVDAPKPATKDEPKLEPKPEAKPDAKDEAPKADGQQPPPPVAPKPVDTPKDGEPKPAEPATPIDAPKDGAPAPQEPPAGDPAPPHDDPPPHDGSSDGR